jgi:hypothetical protein
MEIKVVQVNFAFKINRSRETAAHISSTTWWWGGERVRRVKGKGGRG